MIIYEQTARGGASELLQRDLVEDIDIRALIKAIPSKHHVDIRVFVQKLGDPEKKQGFVTR